MLPQQLAGVGVERTSAVPAWRRRRRRCSADRGGRRTRPVTTGRHTGPSTPGSPRPATRSSAGRFRSRSPVRAGPRHSGQSAPRSTTAAGTSRARLSRTRIRESLFMAAFKDMANRSSGGLAQIPSSKSQIPTTPNSQLPMPTPNANSNSNSVSVPDVGRPAPRLRFGGLTLPNPAPSTTLGFGSWEWLGFGIWSLGFVQVSGVSAHRRRTPSSAGAHRLSRTLMYGDAPWTRSQRDQKPDLEQHPHPQLHPSR